MTDAPIIGTVIDAVFGGTFSVWSVPDEYRGRSAILVHEYDDNRPAAPPAVARPRRGRRNWGAGLSRLPSR